MDTYKGNTPIYDQMILDYSKSRYIHTWSMLVSLQYLWMVEG